MAAPCIRPYTHIQFPRLHGFHPVGEYYGLGATPAQHQVLPGRCGHQTWCKCKINGTTTPCTSPPEPDGSYDCVANMTSELALSYVALAQVLQSLAASGDVFASVMTRVTDIELECDGFMNYDRALKFTVAEL